MIRIVLNETEAREASTCLGSIIRILECVNSGINSGTVCVAIDQARTVKEVIDLKLHVEEVTDETVPSRGGD